MLIVEFYGERDFLGLWCLPNPDNESLSTILYTIINAIVGVVVLGGQWRFIHLFISWLRYSLLCISGCSHRPCPCPWCRWCRRAWCPAGSSARCWGAGPGWSEWLAPPPWHWARPAHAQTRGSRSRCPRSGCPGTRGPACPQARWPARPPAATWTQTPGTRGAGAAGSSPRPSPAEIRPPGDVKDIRGHPVLVTSSTPNNQWRTEAGGGLMDAVNPRIGSMFYWWPLIVLIAAKCCAPLHSWPRETDKLSSRYKVSRLSHLAWHDLWHSHRWSWQS